MTTSPALEKAIHAAASEIWPDGYRSVHLARLDKGLAAYLASLPSGGDVARYRELAIQRITYTPDEYGTAKLSAALHLTQQALAEAAAYLAEIPSGADVGGLAYRLNDTADAYDCDPLVAVRVDKNECVALAKLLREAAAALTASEAARERMRKALLQIRQGCSHLWAVEIAERALKATP